MVFLSSRCVVASRSRVNDARQETEVKCHRYVRISPTEDDVERDAKVRAKVHAKAMAEANPETKFDWKSEGGQGGGVSGVE